MITSLLSTRLHPPTHAHTHTAPNSAIPIYFPYPIRHTHTLVWIPGDEMGHRAAVHAQCLQLLLVVLVMQTVVMRHKGTNRQQTP